MRVMGWTTAALAACSIVSVAGVAEAQCLCDEQCPEDALCRQGRCFEARAAGSVEPRAPGTAGGTIDDRTPGTAEGTLDDRTPEASTDGLGVGAQASVGNLAIGVDASGEGDAALHADAEATGELEGDAELRGDADASGEAEVNADLDEDAATAGVGGAGIDGSIDPDADLRSDPRIDVDGEVEPLGADYTVAIAAFVGLGTAFVATAVGAIAFGGGIDVSVIPVAGPVIKFAQDIGDGFDVSTGLQLSSAIGQVGALTTAVLALLMASGPECPGVGDVACGDSSLALTPVVSDGTLGMDARLSF